MKISRRDFLKWALISSAALAVQKTDINKLIYAMEAIEATPVLWLQAAGCSGCTVSFLNMINSASNNTPNLEELLLDKITLKYHSTLMVESGRNAIETMETISKNSPNQYILVVEGGIPTYENGAFCIIGEKNNRPLTALEAVKTLANNAKHIIAAGTCASFKGVSGAGSNITGVMSVENVLSQNDKLKVINLPGCPVHPYIIGGTIMHLIMDNQLQLDTLKRPMLYYSSKKLHDKENNINNCPLKGRTKTNKLGVVGCCFGDMGCKGKEDQTRVTCYTKYWGTDWQNRKGCFGAGNMCIGCSNINFPFNKIY